MTDQVTYYSKTYHDSLLSGFRFATSESVVIATIPVGVGTGWAGKEFTIGTEVPIKNISNTQSIELQKRIKERWPEVLLKAKKLELLVSNPVDAIMDLFVDISNDVDISEILNEPYG